MREAQMHLINKMFNDKTIRTVWNKDEENYYISVIDIVNALMGNDYQDSRNYWKLLKHRLKKEGNETVTNCNQLKLKAQDGKYRSTDVVDIEVALADLGEIATRELAKKHRPLGLEQNKKVAKMGGHAAKVARDDIEKNLGETVVSKDNSLSYKYVEEDLMIENKE